VVIAVHNKLCQKIISHLHYPSQAWIINKDVLVTAQGCLKVKLRSRKWS